VPPDAVVALYVGRLDYQKGLDTLLHAFARVLERNRRVHLCLAGTGAEQHSLAMLADRLAIVSHVHFLGWREDVPELLQAADFLVLPSRWEGMANAILEAMAAALPVVATRVEGSNELIRDGETGILVGVDRPAELADAILSLAGDAAVRSRLGDAGRNRACADFSLATMIARYEALYDSLFD